ncbi:LOW QUALITY PROTEIN: uncharacterized protein si:dkey-92i17.2 [Pseudorasbora parva]|uniref:LOW QUALITY PROTEIN: uncharacterized protein si:dkey-92i17.2 n=1 Tax=Pseudorasbora parva TaxID=51549 RepID=UPI00351F5DC3
MSELLSSYFSVPSLSRAHTFESTRWIQQCLSGLQPAIQQTRETGAPTLQIALDKAKQTIEIQKQKILHLQEKVDSLTDDKNVLRSRLEDALLRREAVISPGKALTASSSTTAAQSSEGDESSDSSESSDSEPRSKKKKKEKKKKSKKLRVDYRRVRTPEDSIKRYHKVLHLVTCGFTKAEAYNKINVDRNTIVMQAPMAGLAIANPEEYKALRATFKNGESLQKLSDMCLTRCLDLPNAEIIKKLKQSSALLHTAKK